MRLNREVHIKSLHNEHHSALTLHVITELHITKLSHFSAKRIQLNFINPDSCFPRPRRFKRKGPRGTVPEDHAVRSQWRASKQIIIWHRPFTRKMITTTQAWQSGEKKVWAQNWSLTGNANHIPICDLNKHYSHRHMEVVFKKNA